MTRKKRRSAAFFAGENEGAEMVQLVSFSTGADEFAVNIKDVKEINKLSPITHVPGAPEFVEGVINLRGEVVPVINLRERFGLERKDYDKYTRVIIINVYEKHLGLIVDSVSEVLRIPVPAIKEPPVEVIGDDSDFVTGIAEVDEKLVIILDLQKILSSEEVKSIGEIKKAIQKTQEENETIEE